MPQRCNLGFSLINGFEKPIVNENNELTKYYIKKEKGKNHNKTGIEIKKGKLNLNLRQLMLLVAGKFIKNLNE